MKKQVLYFQCRGTWYTVNEKGEIDIGFDFSGQWLFLGISGHHWNNRITVPFAAIWEKPERALKGIVWDLDHGTTRTWGGNYNGKLPRITQIYKGI